MRTVRINREKLLAAIKTNREVHDADYKSAMIAYREAAVERLVKMLQAAKAGEKIERYLDIPQPEQHLREYDQVIEMLGMSVDASIELTNSEFRQYVLDEWVWSHEFASNTKSYNSR